MSSAIEVLLITADTAKTNTAIITVVSLNPLEDDLFITMSCYAGILIVVKFCTATVNVILLQIRFQCFISIT